jgi:hypothetical protein
MRYGTNAHLLGNLLDHRRRDGLLLESQVSVLDVMPQELPLVLERIDAFIESGYHPPFHRVQLGLAEVLEFATELLQECLYVLVDLVGRP